MHRRGAAIVVASCDRPHGGAGCRPQAWSRRCRSLLERTGTDRVEDRMNRLGSKGGDAALPRLQPDGSQPSRSGRPAMRPDRPNTVDNRPHSTLLFRNNPRLLACLFPTHRNRCRSVPKPCRPDRATSGERRCRQPTPNQFIRFIRQHGRQVTTAFQTLPIGESLREIELRPYPHVDRAAVALNCDCNLSLFLIVCADQLFPDTSLLVIRRSNRLEGSRTKRDRTY